MSLPTTDELKELRDRVTPGPWVPMGPQETGWDIEAGNRDYLATFMDIDGPAADNAHLAALALELLDEIIRRREEAGE